MSLAEIEQEVLKLSDSDKADLVHKLLEVLPSTEVDVSDEEIETRERELEAGRVEEISQEEFVRRVSAKRG